MCSLAPGGAAGVLRVILRQRVRSGNATKSGHDGWRSLKRSSPKHDPPRRPVGTRLHRGSDSAGFAPRLRWFGGITCTHVASIDATTGGAVAGCRRVGKLHGLGKRRAFSAHKFHLILPRQLLRSRRWHGAPAYRQGIICAQSVNPVANGTSSRPLAEEFAAALLLCGRHRHHEHGAL
jgi:hypothetical protein